MEMEEMELVIESEDYSIFDTRDDLSSQFHEDGELILGSLNPLQLEEVLSKLNENDESLTKLVLESSNIGPEKATELAAALKENTHLKYLDLSSNEIGPEGAIALAAALKENTTLTELNLWSNGIRGEGAEALADALEKNTALTVLNLGYNQIEDEILANIGISIKRNKIISIEKLGSDPDIPIIKEFDNMNRKTGVRPRYSYNQRIR